MPTGFLRRFLVLPITGVFVPDGLEGAGYHAVRGKQHSWGFERLRVKCNREVPQSYELDFGLELFESRVNLFELRAR